MSKINLKPEMRVLDIGCGTGGSACYMSDKYGVEVLGVDLSPNMLEIANDHKQNLFSKEVGSWIMMIKIINNEVKTQLLA